ncbi:DUF2079 domain-containing protein [Fontivita pretiosa]|uniref:DUF2079 domain-containing protein n=1 Tax=Fontivita pretiosa TaxID=2989684 RepID=UPI003D166156
MALALHTRSTLDDADRLAQPSQPPRREHTGSGTVLLLIALAAAGMLLLSTLRHYLLRSSAFDLGFFDQAIYLISQGQTPISSLHNFHVLADHASIILYPLAVLYLLWPDPHMLLAAQAVALAAGAWPLWRLARQAGLEHGQATALAAAYLMYPVVLASSLFDFHPDVFVLPALLWAILFARQKRPIPFLLAIAVALSCKAIFALTVAAMGMWLLVAERQRFFGIAAIVAGVVWFFIAAKLIVPWFGAGRTLSGLWYYDHLGDSVLEIALSPLLKPSLVLAHLFSLGSLKYLIILATPLIWGLWPTRLWPMLAALPTILLNLLSDNHAQRSPFYHYSLPIVPFLFTSVILAMSSQRAWLTKSQAIVGWSVMLLVLGMLARVSRVSGDHAFDWYSLEHTRQAIARIRGDGHVLTSAEVVPHVSRRAVVDYIGGVVPLRDLSEYDYVLINTRHQSLEPYDRVVSQVLTAAITSHQFHPEYVAPDVFLFRRIEPAAAVVQLARSE